MDWWMMVKFNLTENAATNENNSIRALCVFIGMHNYNQKIANAYPQTWLKPHHRNR